jgi:hypothetical protein
MRQGQRFYVKKSMPCAFVDIKRRRRKHEVRVFANGKQHIFYVRSYGIYWPHPAEVPREIKRMAERAYRQKLALDKRTHIC